MTDKTQIGHTDSELKLIQRAYRRLLRSIKAEIDEEDQRLIRLAYEMAVEAHKEQRRKSGAPYILHPIEVARICAEEIGLGATAIICALLHDVVEDTDVTLKEIRSSFGEKVAQIVNGLTKLDYSYNAESPQAENFRKVLRTLTEDIRVVLIKLADRLHNMRTLGHMPKHKQLKIAAETSYIYAPLAHRLGLYAIKTELEDECMKITNPEEYHDIAQKLQATKKERNAYIQGFIEPLQQRLQYLEYPYRIIGRSKSIYSIWNKLRFKHVDFDDIYDLFAIRIIIDAPHDRDIERRVCWNVYAIVTEVHQPIRERLKDWVTNPKLNGYESLHTSVVGPDGRFVEVQIRTERMDEVAERGFAAHWKYKGITGQEDTFDVWLDQIREILENDDANAVEFLDDFKNSLFQDEVHVYTPQGEVKVLSKGATALDFAFHIHSEVGYHCQSVLVNRTLRPLSYVLQNGDQVKVITNKNQKPNESWLNFVNTGKARSKIRSAVKEERRQKGSMGKEELMRKLRKLKVDYDLNIDMLVKHFDFSSHVDFFYAIYEESFNLQQGLKQFEVQGNKLVPKEENEDGDIPVKKTGRSRREKGAASLEQKNQSRLLINGQPASQFKYSFASCCNPVHGDPVFAFISSSSQITKIHRVDCPNAQHLMANYGYRIMNAEWTQSTQGTFVAELIITGVDDGPGVINRLSDQISNSLGLNIRAFHITGGEEGYFEGRINIVVTDTNQLNRAIHTLRKLPQMTSVVRGNS